MLYDDKADGIISATEFVMLKNKYQNLRRKISKVLYKTKIFDDYSKKYEKK